MSIPRTPGVLRLCIYPGSLYVIGISGILPMTFSNAFSWKQFIVLPCIVCLSVRPALVTTLHPTIFNGSCTNVVQSLTLVGAWSLLIMGLRCSLLGSSGTFKFYEYTDWLVSWIRPAEGSRPLDGIFLLIQFHYTPAQWSWCVYVCVWWGRGMGVYLIRLVRPSVRL